MIWTKILKEWAKYKRLQRRLQGKWQSNGIEKLI